MLEVEVPEACVPAPFVEERSEAQGFPPQPQASVAEACAAEAAGEASAAEAGEARAGEVQADGNHQEHKPMEGSCPQGRLQGVDQQAEVAPEIETLSDAALLESACAACVAFGASMRPAILRLDAVAHAPRALSLGRGGRLELPLESEAPPARKLEGAMVEAVACASCVQATKLLV